MTDTMMLQEHKICDDDE